MKFFIFILLYLIYFQFSIGTSFTKPDCYKCCEAHETDIGKSLCTLRCDKKFSKSQNFDSVGKCKKSCTIMHGIVCESLCNTACDKQFEGGGINTGVGSSRQSSGSSAFGIISEAGKAGGKVIGSAGGWLGKKISVG